MRTVVTGATGFLGYHLVRLLTESGHLVRVYARPQSDLKLIAPFQPEVVRGMLHEPQPLQRALSGRELIFHLAGRHRFWERRPAQVIQVNVDGTQAVLQAMRQCDCGRLVHVSDACTIGREPDDRPATETTPFNLHQLADGYVRSKVRAEQLVREAVAQGLNAVIVNPGLCLGGHDPRPGPAGALILRFLLGRLRWRIAGGCFAACATDVALGLLRAGERGMAGQRYLLGTRELAFEELLLLLSQASGRPVPRRRISFQMAMLAAAAAELRAQLLGGPAPSLTRSILTRFAAPRGTEPRQTEQSLGLTPSPLAHGVDEAVRWARRT